MTIPSVEVSSRSAPLLWLASKALPEGNAAGAPPRDGRGTVVAPLRASWVLAFLALIVGPSFGCSRPTSQQAIASEPLATQSTEEVPAVVQVRPSKLRALLFEERFAELEAHLGEVQRSFRVTPSFETERAASVAFRSFESHQETVNQRLVQWIEADPSSALARLGHGIFLAHKARQVKPKTQATLAGGENPEPNRHKEVRTALETQAREALEAAVRSDPLLIEAYSTLSGLHIQTRDPAACEAPLQDGLVHYPSSYRLHMARLACHLPRRGGSYEAMARIEESLEPYVAENPFLVDLQAGRLWDRARVLASQKDNQKAYELLTQAMEHHQQLTPLRYRASSLIALGRYSEALEDLNKAEQLSPEDAEILLQRVEIHARQSNFEEALDRLKLARQLDPDRPAVRVHAARLRVAAEKTGFALKQHKESGKAAKAFVVACELGSKEACSAIQNGKTTAPTFE